MPIPTQALILAAGRGTRLGELTAERPKPMLPIRGVPMLERILRAIAEQTGIVRFVLVIGYRGDVIQDYFGDGSKFGWQIEYAAQDVPQGVGHAVHCAREQLCGGPFLMTYGDILMDPRNYGRFAQHYGEQGCALVGLNWVKDPTRGAAVYLGDEGSVQRIEEKPAPGTATTHWNNAGLFVFAPIIFEYTARLQPSARGEWELPDAITAMIADGQRVVGQELIGDWRDVGTPEDYAAMNNGETRD